MNRQLYLKSLQEEMDELDERIDRLQKEREEIYDRIEQMMREEQRSEYAQ